jgi:hypothetical protein
MDSDSKSKVLSRLSVLLSKRSTAWLCSDGAKWRRGTFNSSVISCPEQIYVVESERLDRKWLPTTHG